MDNLIVLMSTYQRHHCKTFTKLTHVAGVPCIVFALQLLLFWIHPFMGWLVTLLLLGYYFFLDVMLATVTAIFLLPLTCVAQKMVAGASNIFIFSWFLIIFAGGWILQLLGHYVEGKRPAFTENFFQVFVAPIFLVGELLFVLGYKRKLQKDIIALSHIQQSIDK